MYQSSLPTQSIYFFLREAIIRASDSTGEYGTERRERGRESEKEKEVRGRGRGRERKERSAFRVLKTPNNQGVECESSIEREVRSRAKSDQERAQSDQECAIFSPFISIS
ncbi:hypothetical protein LOK49_LG01G03309 [Camellia lanceoleosa]|uniref:Uncharacterized protein n=1 Tax=Camellia lanceoleosa TaxID=1840588 RepID=A0ACC0J1Y4_9ERIC|nr:hypothetical protein LOK49_LG01G03309 [Camellia lanceoleosa]